MIGVGELAPEFSGTSAEGTPFSLTSLRGRPTVLFFYPKANSLGCTIEVRGFTDHYAEFERGGFSLVGVSVDSVEAQKRFQEKCHVPYPLIADRDRSIAKRYGVLGLLGIAKRVTFVLDREGRIVERIEGMSPGPHVQRSLERLASLAPPGRPSPDGPTIL